MISGNHMYFRKESMYKPMQNRNRNTIHVVKIQTDHLDSDDSENFDPAAAYK